MTELYVARDARQKRVVVRLLREEYARNRRIRKNFIRGAQLLEDIKHPNIVRACRHGCHDGCYYMVLEYIEAPNLRDLILQRAPVLQEHPLCIFKQLAESLLYLHNLGILHLDIKPENILLTDDRKLYLIDFDLCQPYKGKPVKLPDLPGTPSYLAPETMRTHKATEQTDIYAMGTVCYEIVTGHKPYTYGTIEQERAAQLSPNVLPDPPSRYRSDLPAPLCDLLLKCLAKDPAQRYPSASIILKDLKAML